jgi:hypothetical protein
MKLFRKRKRLAELEKLASTRIVVKWVNSQNLPYEKDSQVSTYKVLDVDIESLFTIWRFGGYGQEWHEGIDIGGGSYLILKDVPSGRDRHEESQRTPE